MGSRGASFALTASLTIELAAGALSGAGLACLPPSRMCSGDSDCGASASCVAGRCVLHGATPAIATTRRLLFAPVDEGWVRSADPETGPGDVAVLGRGDGAIVFLRFSVPLAREASVVESYLLLERVPSIDVDPAELSFHAALVEKPWDSRTLSWARQPVTVDLGAPLTRVAVGAAAGARFIRLDVRPILERWRRRDRADYGLAVLVDGTSATGLPVALSPFDVPPDRDDPVLFPRPSPPVTPTSPSEPRPATSAPSGDARRQVHGPRLELYVR